MSASFVRHFTLALLVLEPAGAVDIPLYLAYVGAYSGGWSGGPEMEPAVIMAFEYVISCLHASSPGQTPYLHHTVRCPTLTGNVWQNNPGILPTSITRCVVPHAPEVFGRAFSACSLVAPLSLPHISRSIAPPAGM